MVFSEEIVQCQFLWDGIITNLGFSAGMALSVASHSWHSWSSQCLCWNCRKVSQIDKGIRKTIFSGKSSWNARCSGDCFDDKGAEGAARMYTGITELGKKFLNQYNLLNSTQRNLVNLISIQGESAFESYHNMNDYRNQKIEEYKLTHGGQPPTGEALRSNQ